MRFSDVTSEELFEKAYQVAHLYGFSPANDFVQRFRPYKQKKISAYNTLQEKNLHNLSVLIRFFFERSLAGVGEPFCIFHSNVDKHTKSAITTSKKPDDTHFTLTVIGLADSYAEALVLSCVHDIFRELKSKQHTIRINSMGTREDSMEYYSKLRKTVRKEWKHLSPECRRLVEQHDWARAHMLFYCNEQQDDISEHIIPTLRILSDTARTHFERVIEYVEARDMAYELAPDLVESTEYGVHTVFEMTSGNSPLHARGGRYDRLPYHMFRRHVPVISMTITIPEKTTGTYTPVKKVQKPKAFLVHAGDRARMRSLCVLSKLCEGNIPVAHRLHRIRVQDQMNDQSPVYPYTIIFGQEESEKNAICLRKTDTRASNTVYLNDEGLCREVRNFLRT